MTAEFNITFSAADLIVRLSRLEQQVLNLANDRASDRFMLDTATGKIAGMTDRLTAAERNNESLTAYIQRVETDLGERITATDRARARGDDSMHDLITRTANASYAEVKKLEQRISDCELAVGTDKLEGAPTPNIQTKDPEPPVDTAWKPHDYYSEGRPEFGRHVVVMLRDGSINGPRIGSSFDWDECNDQTIVAWRYAKEGE